MRRLILSWVILSIVVFASIGSAIGDSSLMLYLPFDKTLKDLSGQGNDGVFDKGNPQWEDGKFNQALLIKQGDFVEIDHDSSLDLKVEHTISFRLNLS